jgi:hypothetical protein
MGNAAIVPSCDPITALRRIAQHSREHLLPKLREELRSADVLGPDTRDKLLDQLRAAQRRASVRLLDEQCVDEALRLAEAHPAGVVRADGGHVGSSYRYRAETTYLELAWAPFRGRTLCKAACYRGRTKPRGRCPSIAWSVGQRGYLKALEIISPTMHGIAHTVLPAIRVAVAALRTGVLVPDVLTRPDLHGRPASSRAYPDFAALLVRIETWRSPKEPQTYLCTPYFACRLELSEQYRKPYTLIAAVLGALGTPVAPAEVKRAGARIWEAALPALASAAVNLTLQETQP